MDNEAVPTWDTTFPAEQQQAQLDVLNGRVPTPVIPPPNIQHPIDPEMNAAQMLPDTENTPAQNQSAFPPASTTPNFNDTEPMSDVPRFEDTLPMSDVPRFEDTLPMDNSVQDALNFKLPDNTQLKNYISGSMQVYNAANAERGPKLPQQHEANSMLEAIESGLQISTAGLAIRGGIPDVVLPEHADRAYRIANQIGTFAGDMPAMLAGGIFGGLGGGMTGGVTVPIAGAIPGVAIGAGAGGFALPAALRKIMIDHYTKGDITTAGEFVDRLMATAWETTKGAITGAATAITGGTAAAVSGPLLKFGAELATMTTVGAALEGHLPSFQDFTDGAIVLTGVHATGMVAQKLMNIHAQTGERPETIVAAAMTNPELKQQLLSHDLESPAQASPTDLEHPSATAPTAEGEKPVITPSKLVKQDLGIIPPEPVKIERSPEEQRVLAKIGEKADPKSKSVKDKFDEYYAMNVDWTDPLKVAYAAFKDASGKELSAEENPHIQARLFAGHVDFLRRILNDGVPDETGEFTGVGINDIYKRVPNDDQAGFDAYSMSKRAIELDDKGIVPWEAFDRADVEKVVADGERKFERLHQERVQFQNEVLDYGVRKGVIDSGIAFESKDQNSEYLPFNRIVPPDELTGEIGGSGKLVHKIEGSELELKDPRLSIYNNTAAIIRRAEINDVRTKALLNLNYEDANGILKNDFLREVPVEGGLKKNQIAIFRNGQMYALEGTPLVIDSLRRLEGDRAAADFITKLASGFATAVRLGQTTDPGFAIRHFIRSSTISGMYSKTGQIPFVHPFMALKEFMKGESDTYKNFLSDGGANANLAALEADYISNGLQEADAKYPFMSKAWNAVKHPLEASEAFIKLTDNLTRFTEYKRAIEQGNSRDQSAYLARQVTPDFAKVGIKRSALRTAVAFMGAHINSLDRMRESFVEDPQGTILKMSALSGISAMLYYVNKDDQDIKDLPDYVQDLYWNFNISRMFDTANKQGVPYSLQPDGQKTGTIFKIPKPWGPGILFGSGVERTLDAFFDKNPNAFKGFGHSLLESVIPNIIPSMAAPILDQFANKNLFTGRQLVNAEQQKLLPEMQYQPYTSETAKQVGKLIGYVPGVRDLGPSTDPLASPEVIDNYIKGWTGIAGGWAVGILDAGLRAAGIVPSDVGPSSVEKPVAEYPILNEFMTRFPSMKSKPIDTFYGNYDQTQKVINSIRLATKKGDISTATTIMSQNYGMEMKLDGISKMISTGRKAIIYTQDNPTIGPVEKRQLIDGVLFQIGSAARMGNQMMSDFQKQINDSKTTNSGGR